MPPYLRTVCVLLVWPTAMTSAQAERGLTLAHYDATVLSPAPSPLTEEGGTWLVSQPGEPGTNPVEDQGLPAWSVSDLLTTAVGSNYSTEVHADARTDIDEYGWTLTATLRVVAGGTSGGSFYFGYAEPVRRWDVYVDLDESNNFVIYQFDSSTGFDRTIESGGAGDLVFHTVVIEKGPVASTASVSIDGVELGVIEPTNYGPGLEPPGVRFGAGSTSGDGHVHLRSIEFVGAQAPSVCVGDIDGDSDTDVFDFNNLAANFGNPAVTPGELGDLDGDGDVDVFDFNIFAPDFGCTPP